MTCFMAFRAQWKCVLSIATLAGALILASFTARSEETKPAAPDMSLIEKGNISRGSATASPATPRLRANSSPAA